MISRDESVVISAKKLLMTRGIPLTPEVEVCLEELGFDARIFAWSLVTLYGNGLTVNDEICGERALAYCLREENLNASRQLVLEVITAPKQTFCDIPLTDKLKMALSQSRESYYETLSIVELLQKVLSLQQGTFRCDADLVCRILSQKSAMKSIKRALEQLVENKIKITSLMLNAIVDHAPYAEEISLGLRYLLQARLRDAEAIRVVHRAIFLNPAYANKIGCGIFKIQDARITISPAGVAILYNNIPCMDSLARHLVNIMREKKSKTAGVEEVREAVCRLEEAEKRRQSRPTLFPPPRRSPASRGEHQQPKPKK